MGAGHDAVAGELARGLRSRGHDVLVRDVLTLLPAGTGTALRAFYRGSVRHLPRLYAAIYRTFLAPAPAPDGGAPGDGRPDSSPLAALAGHRLAELADRKRPDVVVSTFHLAGQITGRLRARGELAVPSVVVVTDFAVHRGWLHPGNDLYLCVSEPVARAVRAATGRPAVTTGPIVSPHYHRPTGTRAGATTAPAPSASTTSATPSAPSSRPAPSTHSAWPSVFARHGPGRPAVLLSAGAWGVGSRLPETASALHRRGLLPVLLCGRDERLRRRAARLPGVLALGWVEDMAELFASVRVLIDNAAGQTAAQALASGVPVIGFRPIPGHGADGVREMAAAGLSVHAKTPRELLAALDLLIGPGPARDERVAGGRSAFRADAAHLLHTRFGPFPTRTGTYAFPCM
ncbi:MGDG synthase family glycosyltransferase [Streptomyces sp. DT171]|uniref:MGDG synthase family glycosyltransferase n=1 Tax=Streptomyces sp. DT171 TaxID=3416524 RepID=UPI003CF7A69A